MFHVFLKYFLFLNYMEAILWVFLFLLAVVGEILVSINLGPFYVKI